MKIGLGMGQSAIMMLSISSKLRFEGRLWLRRACAVALLGLFLVVNPPQTRAQSPAPSLQFDVASVEASTLIAHDDTNPESIDISPGGRLTMRNVRLITCIRWAYRVQDSQISGPGWLSLERYDVVAQAPGPTTEDNLRLMLQSLLADRFRLVLHRAQKATTAYALVVAKGGPKFHQSQEDGNSNIHRTPVGVTAELISMSEFADLLSGQLNTPVVDRSGLKGRFDLAYDLRQYVANATTPLSISSLILGDGRAARSQAAIREDYRRCADRRPHRKTLCELVQRALSIARIL